MGCPQFRHMHYQSDDRLIATYDYRGHNQSKITGASGCSSCWQISGAVYR